MARTKSLFPYQEEGRDFLAARKTALLFDEPRLGKAVQSISALDTIGANFALVCARGIARANWVAEFARWSKRNWACHVIYGRTDRINWVEGRPNVVITSYESLTHALTGSGAKRFDCAIVDESHYIKSIDAKRTSLVLGKTGIPSRSNKIWLLTGTPTPNGLASELWPALFTFGCTKLSFWDFAKKFCIVRDTGYGTQIVGTNTDPKLIAELKALMAPKVLRREARNLAVQLPKMSFSTVMVTPGKVNLRETTFWKYCIPEDKTADLAEIIQSELGIINGILEGDHLAGEVIEVLKAQSKSISTLRKYTALQKLEPACELIAQELEANAYQKCVIFAHHRDMINGAARLLHKFSPVTLYGGTAPSRAERNLKNFQNPKNKVRVFIGQISAAGTSISLSTANHIFFLEESFVPDDNTQAAMRCGGVNQPNPIFVRTFCLENSYDFRLQNILRQKMSESALMFNTNNPLAGDPLADMY